VTNWVDIFVTATLSTLWKFASAERREWLAQSYRFVNVHATSAAQRPAPV